MCPHRTQFLDLLSTFGEFASSKGGCTNKLDTCLFLMTTSNITCEKIPIVELDGEAIRPPSVLFYFLPTKLFAWHKEVHVLKFCTSMVNFFPFHSLHRFYIAKFAKLASQLHSFIRIHLPAVTSSVSNTSLQAFPALVAQLFELNFFWKSWVQNHF